MAGLRRRRRRERREVTAPTPGAQTPAEPAPTPDPSSNDVSFTSGGLWGSEFGSVSETTTTTWGASLGYRAGAAAWRASRLREERTEERTQPGKHLSARDTHTHKLPAEVGHTWSYDIASTGARLDAHHMKGESSGVLACRCVCVQPEALLWGGIVRWRDGGKARHRTLLAHHARLKERAAHEVFSRLRARGRLRFRTARHKCARGTEWLTR